MNKRQYSIEEMNFLANQIYLLFSWHSHYFTQVLKFTFFLVQIFFVSLKFVIFLVSNNKMFVDAFFFLGQIMKCKKNQLVITANIFHRDQSEKNVMVWLYQK